MTEEQLECNTEVLREFAVQERQNKWVLTKLRKIQRGEMTLEHLVLQLEGKCWVCGTQPTIDAPAGPGAIDTCPTCFDRY